MKKYLFIISIFFLLIACNNTGNSQGNNPSTNKSATTVSIKGKLNNLQKGWVVLEKFDETGYQAVDSVEVKSKEFTLKVALSEPDFFRLNIFKRKPIPLVISEKDKEILIELDVKEDDIAYQVKGSKDSEYYIQLNDFITNLKKNEAVLVEKFQNAKDEATQTKLQEEYMTMASESAKEVKKMIDAMKPSIVGLTASSFLFPPDGNLSDEDFDYLNNLAKLYKEKLPNSRFSVRFADQMAKMSAQRAKTAHLSLGKAAPEIDLLSPDGKSVKLSSLKGKLVLIDFWASWCGPCRRENPNVVRVYNQYKSKGFEIYGVSLDKDRNAWLKAIEQDGLTWLHVFDQQSAAAQTYQVSAIPQTYLIDKNGNILAKNLRGKALESKVAEVLK
jgi:peroxiredoxin